MLYTCYDLAEQGLDFSDALDAIQARYNDIISGLGRIFLCRQNFLRSQKTSKSVPARIMPQAVANI